MRIIRVRKENQAAIINAIISAGFSARAVGCPHNREGNGCGDEACCPGSRHVSAINPAGWAGIETSASGNQAHKIIENNLTSRLQTATTNNGE